MKPLTTVKSLKVARFASQTSLCFEAKIHVDGRPFCIVSNEGRGSCNNFDELKGGPKNLWDAMDEVGKRLDPNSVATDEEAKAANDAAGIDPDELGWEEWKAAYAEGRIVRTSNAVCESALDDAVMAADLERELKRLLKNRIVITRKDKPGVFHTKTMKPDELAQQLCNPQLAEAMGARQVLNLMSLDEALKVYAEEPAY